MQCREPGCSDYLSGACNPLYLCPVFNIKHYLVSPLCLHLSIFATSDCCVHICSHSDFTGAGPTYIGNVCSPSLTAHGWHKYLSDSLILFDGDVIETTAMSSRHPLVLSICLWINQERNITVSYSRLDNLNNLGQVTVCVTFHSVYISLCIFSWARYTHFPSRHQQRLAMEHKGATLRCVKSCSAGFSQCYQTLLEERDST